MVIEVSKVNSAQSNVTIYYNNRSLGTQTLNGAVGSTKGRGWTIGQDWDGNNESDYYNGAVDNVGIYNHVLTADEISALYREDSCRA